MTIWVSVGEDGKGAGDLFGPGGKVCWGYFLQTCSKNQIPKSRGSRHHSLQIPKQFPKTYSFTIWEALQVFGTGHSIPLKADRSRARDGQVPLAFAEKEGKLAMGLTLRSKRGNPMVPGSARPIKDVQPSNVIETRRGDGKRDWRHRLQSRSSLRVLRYFVSRT